MGDGEGCVSLIDSHRLSPTPTVALTVRECLASEMISWKRSSFTGD